MMRIINNAWTSDRPCGWFGTALLTLAVTALAATAPGVLSGCTKDHCENDTHCRPGEQCNLDTNQCYTPGTDAGDTGDAQADGGDGSDGGDAQPTDCTGHGECTTALEPVCLSNFCEPCGNSTQCNDKNTDRPLCDDGQCVECTVSETHCLASTVSICNAGTCVACVDDSADCEIPYPDSPFCLNDECVQCTDSADHCATPTPTVCDPADHTCRDCEAHSECDYLGGVCDWSTGDCMDPTNIIYVDDDTGCSDSGSCDATTPCCAIEEALDRVNTSVSTILVAAGSYTEITIHNQDVWIIGQPGAIIGPSGLDINVVTVQNLLATESTQAIIEGLTIQTGSNTGVGVYCSGLAAAKPDVTLRNCTITNNAGGGVDASDCIVTLESNEISANTGGGVYLGDSDYTVVNNMITKNGSPSSSYGGVQIFNPGTPHRFHSNTVVGNDAQSIEGGIWCSPAAEVVNTIAYQNTDGDIATACTVIDSWTTGNGDPLFVSTTDFHLTANSDCIDAGGTVNPPILDFDGQTRDATPDIGADEYF
jgi:parallel beta-helix repeat protein